jgi:hypothetical protein
VTAIRRDPTPPGPVTELFNRLDQLHLAAGRPSMREIATKAGRGKVSSSTVHNVFRGARVPRWNFLEEIVRVLDGDTGEFKVLWQNASQAENKAKTSQGHLPDVSPPAQIQLESAALGPAQRIWSAEIPSRNPNFTGRVKELEELRENLFNQARQHPPAQVISGMGGMGKTEIATEYIHLHRDEYEIIWWLRAEQPDRVGEALVKLGQRLELRLAAAGGRDRAIAGVLDALESGIRPNWLLVYDNAAQPLDLQRYLPACPPGGHIIITSRLQNWPGFIEADSIEVSPFTVPEAVSFLRRRVPSLGAGKNLSEEDNERRVSEARRVAAALGHLPIAVEHAAAYLRETGQSVHDYLGRFAENAHGLLSVQPTESLASVSATWTMSTKLLSEDAMHLFNLCAFFSPEPIAGRLFLENGHAVSDPPGLREFLSSSPRFRAAATQMHRLSLLKVDGARDQIQMHRVVQAVTRSQLRQNRPEMFRAYRASVDVLLAESNPGNPDRAVNEATYDLSLQHLESDPNFLNTANPALRQLIIDQVRRLHLRGNHREAMRFGQEALTVWRDRLGQDDLQVLTLAIEVAIAMRSGAHAAGARELILGTRRLLRERYDDEHEVTLLCENTYGADLRSRGQSEEALELDTRLLPKFERAFGKDHDRTLNVRNNIAADYRRLGHYQKALDTDLRNLEDRQRILGPDDPVTLSSFDAVARDLRDLGRYQESLDTARKVVEGFAAIGGRENLDWLNARKSFAAALRKAGYHWDALQESEEVVQRYRDYLGPDHTYTLRAASNLINDRRAVGELIRAEELGREVLDRCRQAGFPSDLGYATLVSLAAVLRLAGKPDEAQRYDLQARDGLINAYGDMHPFTLEASINYASDLAAGGDLAAAIRIGQDTLANCRGKLGPSHPDTLMAAANLAIDDAASGNKARADRLLADALSRYEATLTKEHPEAQAAARRARLTAEIEPY